MSGMDTKQDDQPLCVQGGPGAITNIEEGLLRE